MKMLIVALGIVFFTTALALPAMARGWGMGPGTCWQDSRDYGPYGDSRIPQERDQRQEYDRRSFDRQGSPFSFRDRFDGFGSGMTGFNRGFGSNHMGGFGMGWWR